QKEKTGNLISCVFINCKTDVDCKRADFYSRCTQPFNIGDLWLEARCVCENGYQLNNLSQRCEAVEKKLEKDISTKVTHFWYYAVGIVVGFVLIVTCLCCVICRCIWRKSN